MMRLKRGKNNANGGGRVEFKECWSRSESEWRGKLIEKPKNRVVSVVELRELLTLLTDWIVSVVELRELLALLRDWVISVVELRELLA